jgi:hypothetical protein
MRPLFIVLAAQLVLAAILLILAVGVVASMVIKHQPKEEDVPEPVGP